MRLSMWRTREGRRGRPRGFWHEKIIASDSQPQGDNIMSESPGCRVGFSTIFNVRHPTGVWVGTKVSVRTPTPGGFSWSDPPGLPPPPPPGHHIDRCITKPNDGRLSNYASQRKEKKKQEAYHRGVGPIAGHTNMCWLIVLTNLYLKINVCSEFLTYSSWLFPRGFS